MERLRILFLAANPGSMGQVNAGREAREIRERLRAAEHRDAIELVERFAVRPGDLQRAFFEVRPHVVHFSGHGTVDEELVLEGDDGAAQPLGKGALSDLFRVHKDTIRVVVLSACHSRPQVEAIAEHVECAIGMRRAVGSLAATEFSAAFYLAVGFGASVATAFESAVAELRARGIPEDRTPQLVVRAGTDATRVILFGREKSADPVTPPPRRPLWPFALVGALVVAAGAVGVGVGRGAPRAVPTATSANYATAAAPPPTGSVVEVAASAPPAASCAATSAEPLVASVGKPRPAIVSTAKKPTPPGGSSEKPAAGGCAPPYTVDASGHRTIKPECNK